MVQAASTWALSRRTGAIVFSSSRGTELSYERDEWRNGAFTAELKVALTSDAADTNRDGRVSTEELRKYVSAAVAKRTGELQHPTVDRDNLEIRFALLTVPAANTPVVHMRAYQLRARARARP